jgi:uncharacterized Rmd1/YagE family protein
VLRPRKAVPHNRAHALQDAADDGQQVSLTAYCAAFEYDLVGLYETFKERFAPHEVEVYPEDSLKAESLAANRTPDMLHTMYTDENNDVCGDVFIFEVRSALLRPFL